MKSIIFFLLILAITLLAFGCTQPQTSVSNNSNDCASTPYLQNTNNYTGEGTFELAIGNTYLTNEFSLKLISIKERYFMFNQISGNVAREFMFELDKNNSKISINYCDGPSSGASNACTLTNSKNEIGSFGITITPTKFACVESNCGTFGSEPQNCKQPTRFDIEIKKIN